MYCPLDLSLGVTTGIKINKSLELLKTAETQGYTTVWVGDDILKEEIFTYTSILSNNVKKMNVGIGVLSPYVYSISTIASASATLSELTAGRFILGLGVGGIIEVEKMTGKKPTKMVDNLKFAVNVLRRLFKSEKVSFNKDSEKLVEFNLSFTTFDVPIYFGVRGPKLLSLAGEIADGVIFSAPIDLLKDSINIVTNSAKMCGRNPNNIRKVLWNAFIFSKDKKSLSLAKNVVMVILSSLNDIFLEKIKIDVNLVNKIKKNYACGRKDKALSLIDESMIRKLSIFGDLEEIKTQLIELSKIGIDEVILGPPFGVNPLQVISTITPNIFLE
ncbi:MAG: LLM class flavin-dependent oxidoreductase [Candidatus Odinarchaeia archaeon]